jgi:hypothetical protein
MTPNKECKRWHVGNAKWQAEPRVQHKNARFPHAKQDNRKHNLCCEPAEKLIQPLAASHWPNAAELRRHTRSNAAIGTAWESSVSVRTQLLEAVEMKSVQTAHEVKLLVPWDDIQANRALWIRDNSSARTTTTTTTHVL